MSTPPTSTTNTADLTTTALRHPASGPRAAFRGWLKAVFDSGAPDRRILVADLIKRASSELRLARPTCHAFLVANCTRNAPYTLLLRMDGEPQIALKAHLSTTPPLSNPDGMPALPYPVPAVYTFGFLPVPGPCAADPTRRHVFKNPFIAHTAGARGPVQLLSCDNCHAKMIYGARDPSVIDESEYRRGPLLGYWPTLSLVEHCPRPPILAGLPPVVFSP